MVYNANPHYTHLSRAFLGEVSAAAPVRAWLVVWPGTGSARQLSPDALDIALDGTVTFTQPYDFVVRTSPVLVVGVTDTYDGRAVALADLWNRGVLDVVVVNQKGPLLLYKNTVAPDHQWIAFALEGIFLY